MLTGRRNDNSSLLPMRQVHWLPLSLPGFVYDTKSIILSLHHPDYGEFYPDDYNYFVGPFLLLDLG
jgi:hypothetical protein